MEGAEGAEGAEAEGAEGAEAEGAEGAEIRTSGETAEGRDPQRLFFSDLVQTPSGCVSAHVTSPVCRALRGRPAGNRPATPGKRDSLRAPLALGDLCTNPICGLGSLRLRALGILLRGHRTRDTRTLNHLTGRTFVRYNLCTRDVPHLHLLSSPLSRVRRVSVRVYDAGGIEVRTQAH
jgi:hypothetical protein